MDVDQSSGKQSIEQSVGRAAEKAHSDHEFMGAQTCCGLAVHTQWTEVGCFP